MTYVGGTDDDLPNFSKVPQEVWEDLKYEIARNDLDYADNYRAYRYKDSFLKDEFIKADNQGCCGCFESHTVVDGEKWIIGANYGH